MLLPSVARSKSTAVRVTVRRVTGRVTRRGVNGVERQAVGAARPGAGRRPVDPPRGNKAWGFLAYLVRTRVPPSREHLAGLLFPEADDPLGALRWTLSTLRRRLGEHAELDGDPVRLSLPAGAFVDSTSSPAGPGWRRPRFPGSGASSSRASSSARPPASSSGWRASAATSTGTTSAVLHQAALARLGRGEALERRDTPRLELVRLTRTTRTHTSCSSAVCGRPATYGARLAPRRRLHRALPP